MTDRPKTAICILASLAATLLILLFVTHLPRYLPAQPAAPTSCLGSPQAAAERSGTQSICPPAAPTDGTACGTVNGECTYTGSECSCGNSNNWNCRETLVCPATKPTIGAACTEADGTCPYTGLGTCRCGQTEKWTCSNSCPGTQPVVGSACTASTAVCEYATADCGCLNEKWACN